MFRVVKNGLAALACLAFLAVSLPGTGHAALDLDPAIAEGSDMELLVVETDDCVYCVLFRRDVVPAYESSERAKSVPMRFVDINAVDHEGLALQGPIDSVPTVLLVKSKQEAGRIPGYVGPENFFHSVNYLLTSVF